MQKSFWELALRIHKGFSNPLVHSFWAFNRRYFFYTFLYLFIQFSSGNITLNATLFKSCVAKLWVLDAYPALISLIAGLGVS